MTTTTGDVPHAGLGAEAAPLAIRLRQVTVTDEGGRRVLDSVSLSVTAGEAVALVGHNGGGKTSVLRLIAGLIAPTSGTVEVNGADLGKLDYEGTRAQRVGTGLAFEAGGLWVNRTIGENIALPLRYHPMPPLSASTIHERVAAIAAELDITASLDQPSSMTNASVRKRALIARALVLRPRVLLCDEPQVGLVSKESRRVARAIERRRRDEGLSVLFADHDGELDPYVVDRIVYLENGRIFERPSDIPPEDRPSFIGVLSLPLGGSNAAEGDA